MTNALQIARMSVALAADLLNSGDVDGAADQYAAYVAARATLASEPAPGCDDLAAEIAYEMGW